MSSGINLERPDFLAVFLSLTVSHHGCSGVSDTGLFKRDAVAREFFRDVGLDPKPG
jgi:hypothetical protein